MTLRKKLPELEQRHRCPVVVLSDEEYQAILDGEVVVKEKNGKIYPFHNGVEYSAYELQQEYENCNHAPYSGSWEELRPGDFKNWNFIVAYRENKYNLPR